MSIVDLFCILGLFSRSLFISTVVNMNTICRLILDDDDVKCCIHMSIVDLFCILCLFCRSLFVSTVVNMNTICRLILDMMLKKD